MNEEYVGTGMLNSATADRFDPIYLEDQMDLAKLLTSMDPWRRQGCCQDLRDHL